MRRPIATVAALIATVVSTAVAPSVASASRSPRTPVVFFPGYGTTILQVTVRGQHGVAGCAPSGSFQDGIPADVGTTYDEICRARLLTPSYPGSARIAIARRFRRPAGVRVTIPHYGEPSSAPVYAGLYSALERAGYVPGVDLLVAGYDFYLTPDLGGFLPRTERLIEVAAHRAGRPVRLVGHSNGPLYAQYLLTHVSTAWKRRYVQGFTDIAGNLPGQGSLWANTFTGLDVSGGFASPTTPAAARASARLIAESPSTWMSTADPAVFGHREIVVRAGGRAYTPADTFRLLRDAGLESLVGLARHYLGFVRFADQAHFPGVDVTAERGSGLVTQVGIALPNLQLGQVFSPTGTPAINGRGDGNQEDITNTAVSVWSRMRCHRFRLIDNPGVEHVGLTSNPGVIGRLLADLRRTPSRCA